MEILIATRYFVNLSALRANLIPAIKSVRLIHEFLPNISAIRIERSTFRRGMRMCIVNLCSFPFNFWTSETHFVLGIPLFSSEYSPFPELMAPFFQVPLEPFCPFPMDPKVRAHPAFAISSFLINMPS